MPMPKGYTDTVPIGGRITPLPRPEPTSIPSAGYRPYERCEKCGRQRWECDAMGLERPTYWHRLFGTRARLASMDEALQRIRIAATMGNPMDPEKAAVTMGDIDELARVALRAPAAPKAGYSREMSEALWGPYPAAPKEEA